MDKTYYPVFLDLSGHTVLVVGGGEVALRKVEALAAAGAPVRVVAPKISQAVRAVAGTECRDQPYDPEALDGVRLAIAATDSAEVNARVAADCRARSILCNVVDVPEQCDFIVPSVFRQGPLVIAVSTGGASPHMAARIRQTMEEQFGAVYGRLLETLGRVRRSVRARVDDATTRRRISLRLAEDDVLTAARAGADALKRKVADVLREFGLKEDGP